VKKRIPHITWDTYRSLRSESGLIEYTAEMVDCPPTVHGTSRHEIKAAMKQWPPRYYAIRKDTLSKPSSVVLLLFNYLIWSNYSCQAE